jgi:hypothetical protein
MLVLDLLLLLDFTIYMQGNIRRVVDDIFGVPVLVFMGRVAKF